MICVPWSPEIEPRALAFLEERFATSMFLLGNREDRGTKLAAHPNSGNFHVVLDEDAVTAVFCLTRRGNLIVSGAEGAADLAIAQCAREAIPLKGVLGSWELAAAAWARFASPTCSFQSKEVLFELSALVQVPPVPGVRFLTAQNFDEWLPIRRAYQAEEGIVHELPLPELRANFERYCGMKEYWGYYEGGRMVATAALNARALDIGQVGGVYTVPELRGRGYSQRLMRQMLSECASVHGLRRMILFTGEKNFAAQKVYEKCGFRRIGHFGIFFV